MLEDNETTQPIFYSTTNSASENITVTVTLPNNRTIERTVPVGESLVYVKTKENYIIIPESNVTFQSISADDGNINIEATSSGEKCFDIYTDKGKPYSIKVNDNLISFTYDYTTKLIHFCLTFSTKSIAITWVIPIPSAVSVSGSGAGSTGGGSPGFSYPAVIEEKPASPPSVMPEEKAPEEKTLIPEIKEAPPKEVAPAEGILARITGGIVTILGGPNKLVGIAVIVVTVLLGIFAYYVHRRSRHQPFK